MPTRSTAFALWLGLVATAVGPDALAAVDNPPQEASSAAGADIAVAEGTGVEASAPDETGEPARRQPDPQAIDPEAPDPQAIDPEAIEGRAEPLPEELEGVTIVEKLGDQVPLDLTFRDETGRAIRLGDLFETGQPVILTFNYSNCPMLCSVQLGGLVEALVEMPLSAGAQFKIITVGLDPKETPKRAAETKASYLDRYPRATADKGWRFLTGDEASVRALADAVGFGYTYYPKRAEYLHPAAFMVLSPAGKVTNYTYGVSYQPADVVRVLTAAAVGESVESAQKFILSCYHYIGDAVYARRAEAAMRYAGIGFVALFGGLLGALAWRRRHRAAEAHA